jgi:BirA family transcriptional regulator, biotin operon repressor / biotin---[acetyl-CoA-carboxylase] ligase
MTQNRLSGKSIKECLPSEMIRWDVHYFPELESTQQKAVEIFRNESRGGVFVSTNCQTSGRGRGGNSWIAPRGEALLFSFILLPGHAPTKLHLLTITTALAVCDALRSHIGLKPDLKWPNDVLCNGKKLCGILTEVVTAKNGEKGIIAGVGINVNQGKAAFSGELSEIATSVKLESGKKIPRLPFLGSVMKYFEDQYFLFQKGEFKELIRRWKSYSSMLGRDVGLKVGNRNVKGTVLDLEDSGALVLRLDSGKTESFFGSDCRFI